MKSNQIRDLSELTLFSGFLGVLNYNENLKQTSNNEISDKLDKQDRVYLSRIIEQNETIIKLLKEVKDSGNR